MNLERSAGFAQVIVPITSEILYAKIQRKDVESYEKRFPAIQDTITACAMNRAYDIALSEPIRESSGVAVLRLNARTLAARMASDYDQNSFSHG